MRPDKKGLIGGETNEELKRKIKALETTSAKEVRIEELHTRKPFVDFLPIKEEKVPGIVENMKLYGYDKAQPIFVIIEHGNYFVVDGHTRLHSAKLAGLTHVWIIVLDFKLADFKDQKAMDDHIIKYMVRIQFTRRDNSEHLLVMMAIRFQKNKDDDDTERAQFAKTFGLKDTKAGHIITVAKNADAGSLKLLEQEKTTVNRLQKAVKAVKKLKNPEIWEKISQGKLTVLDVYEKIKQKEQKLEQKKFASDSLGNVTTPPAEPPVTTPPADPPVTTPPAEPPVTTPPAEPPVTTPPADINMSTLTSEDSTLDSGNDIGLPSFDLSSEKKEAVFDECKKYMHNLRTQPAALFLACYKEHLIALEKLGILDWEIVEYLVDKSEEL